MATTCPACKASTDNVNYCGVCGAPLKPVAVARAVGLPPPVEARITSRPWIERYWYVPIILWVFFEWARHQPSTSSPSPAPDPTSVADVTVDELDHAYHQNEVRAQQEWGSRSLRISAGVREIGISATGDRYLSFHVHNWESSAASAFLATGQDEAAASLRLGQEVTVLCQGAAFVFKSVALYNCRIEAP